nr:hypothetical protein [Tanacetum cinerariifolium]
MQMIGVQNVENQVTQNPRVQNVGNQNGPISVRGNGNQNQIGNGNLVAVRAEENAAGHNGNQIRLLRTQEFRMLEIRMGQLVFEEMEIRIRLGMQASSSGTETDSTPVYDTDGSTENDNNVISEVTDVEQDGEIVEQHSA